MDLISIIVPVYKVEKYLDKCVQSIVDQTYKNLEIILVDDGSPDHCGAMCDAWAAKDSRIKVIHQENQGGGPARNAGLDIARGDFIGFVDSDDYISPHMYTHLYNLMTPGVDLTECCIVKTSDDNMYLDDGSAFVSEVYDVRDAMRMHINNQLFLQTPPNKLYRAQILKDVRFPSGTGIDDEFWTYRAIGNARRLVHSRQIMYAYRQQSQSVMHTLNTQRRIRAVEAKRQRHDYIVVKFPELVDMSLKSLWFTGLYQGQFAFREATEEAKQAVEGLAKMLRGYSALKVQGSWKERGWLLLAHISFKNTCRLRNWLKIGL